MTVVSAAALILAGTSAIVTLLLVPAFILWNASRASNGPRFYTATALVLWVCISVLVASVWFMVAVAAHSVDESHLYTWIAANVGYPVTGAILVLSHRRLIRSSHRSRLRR